MTSWKMHKKQGDVFQSQARFKVVSAGRRWGKSELGCMMQAKTARELALQNKDGVIWIIEPTSTELPTIWRKFRKIVPKGWITDKSGTEKQPNWYKIGNIIVQFRSADRPERLVAEGLRSVWIDEAGMVKGRTWNESVRPTLIDYRAPALITGTPKGRNWFYKVSTKGFDPENSKYQTFHGISYENPFIPASEINELASDMPRRIYQQEIMAKFLDDSASVFRGVEKIIGKLSTEPTIVVGVDLAKAEDFTVLIGLDAKGNVTFIDRFNTISWPLQKKRIVSKAKKTGAFFLIDSTGLGDPIVDDLEVADVNCEGYQFTNKSKSQLVEGLEIAIEQQDITIPNDRVLINELQSYTYSTTRTGKMKYSAPEGMHDDCVMALGLARMALTMQHKRPQIRVL